MSKTNHKLWVEKYRPNSLADIIFQDTAQQKFFESKVKEGDIPNLLFAGVQGTGKTTLSLALINELNVDPNDVMLVKCSDETGVDNIRDNVARFAETMPFGDYRVVRLEEFDYLSHNSQAILRHIIEDSSSNCRFIATCNYANKITGPVKSRFQEFHFKAPDQEHIIVKMADMLMAESIDLDEAGLEALEKIVSASYPDIRKTIQLLQQSCSDGVLRWSTSVSAGDSADYKLQLLDLIEANNFTAARKLVCENANREDYEDLYKWLYQNIHRAKKFSTTEAEEKAIVVISDHLYRHASFAHVDINLAAMFINLSNI